MKQLYFMRHGLSEMNKLGRFSGRIDTPLAPEGKLQCVEAGRALLGVDIHKIISSPMERAYESAVIVANEIGYPKNEIIIHELFMERDLGSLEGKKYKKGLTMSDVAGLEHSNNLVQRAKAGLDYLNSLDADVILVVSHSALGRALVHVLDPKKDFSQIGTFANAEVIRLI